MLLLERAQLADEQVVVAVGDLGVVELVVAAVVVGDLLAQRGHPGGHVIELAGATSFLLLPPLSRVRHPGQATPPRAKRLATACSLTRREISRVRRMTRIEQYIALLHDLFVFSSPYI